MERISQIERPQGSAEAHIGVSSLRAAVSMLRSDVHAILHSSRGNLAGTLRDRPSVASLPQQTTADTGEILPGFIRERVYFSQHDKRWSGNRFALPDHNQTIAESGCVPVCMATIISNITQRVVLPDELCDHAVQNSFRTPNNGTKRSFPRAISREFNLGYGRITSGGEERIRRMTSAINASGFVLISGRGTDETLPATPTGHSFVLTDIYSDGTCNVLDPNSLEKSQRPYWLSHILGTAVSVATITPSRTS